MTMHTGLFPLQAMINLKKKAVQKRCWILLGLTRKWTTWSNIKDIMLGRLWSEVIVCYFLIFWCSLCKEVNWRILLPDNLIAQLSLLSCFVFLYRWCHLHRMKKRVPSGCCCCGLFYIFWILIIHVKHSVPLNVGALIKGLSLESKSDSLAWLQQREWLQTTAIDSTGLAERQQQQTAVQLMAI